MTEESAEIYIPHNALSDLCTGLFTKAGLLPDHARTVADCLVEANLTGVDTHGVLRTGIYIERIKNGGNNTEPQFKTLRENACTALIDADNAMGAVAGKMAMEMAIDKAQKSGIALVLIRNANHYGAAGWYTRMAAEKDLIGISLTNVLACMPPTGGAGARLGNNPYSIAFPSGEEPIVMVDAATSKSSWGKLFLCAQQGEPLPPDCYVDKNGQPTLDAKAVMDGGALLPFGGYKGYGIATAIELLTGMLADAPIAGENIHPYKHTDLPGENTFFMGAISVDNFMDKAAFKHRMDEWIRLIRSTPRAPGVDRIWLPGEKEAVTRMQRIEKGIPLGQEMINELKDLCQTWGVEFDL